MSKPGRIDGKAALITGAAGGLGQATAWRLVREGARVALTDIDGVGAQRLADAINAFVPDTAFAFQHDVAEEDQWRSVVEQAAVAMGGLSVLVNNAGIGQSKVFAEDSCVDTWQRLYEINLKSVMLGCKHGLPHLRRASPASIVNISSIAGLVAAPGMGAYSATKAAVWMYTKTVALECAKHDWDVRCNSVHPVYIRTPILDAFRPDGEQDRAVDEAKLARGIPLKRIGDPDDVAWCVLYLASDESRFITGAEFKIDGGLTAQ